MPPADLQADACADSTIDPTDQPQGPSPRSPQLVRLLILAAFGVGLLGVSLPGGRPSIPTVAVTSAAVQTEFAPSRLQGDVPVRHASRSRAAAAKPAVKPAVKKAAAHKKAAIRKKAKRVVRGPRWARPSGAGIVSPYGMRWGRMHKGIDFGASYGAPIRAVGDGVVIGAGYLGSESGYGKITIIRHPDGTYSAYAHQSRTAVSAGEHVSAGEVIGYVGSTGHSTGPHLHFEIRMSPHGGQVNPSRWLRAHGVFV